MIYKNEIAKKLNKNPEDIVVGITFSTFDLSHAGHYAMLRECKDNCDYLIVGLLADPTVDRAFKNKPVQSMFERYMQISGCKYVDEVVPFDSEDDLVNVLETLNPDIRFVGEEYEGTDFTGKDVCKVYFNKRRHKFSSSELRSRIYIDELKKQVGADIIEECND